MKLFQTSIFAATLILASSAIGSIRPITDIVDDINPAFQVSNQQNAMMSQEELIKDAISSIPAIVVSDELANLSWDDVIIQAVPKLDDESEAIAKSLEESLKGLNGQFGDFIPDTPLTKKFITSLPTPHGGSEFECLAEALYFEGRGETLSGQRAIAEVILNRVASKQFPNTICDVVNQGTGKIHQCQFSYTCDGVPEVVHEAKAYDTVSKVARLMMDGLYEKKKITGGALFYHTTAVRPYWASSMSNTAKLGSHIFYR